MDQAKNAGPVDYIQQGEQALVNEEWEAALAFFNQGLQLLKQQPETPLFHLAEAYNGQGAALMQLEQFSEAEAVLRKALEYQPFLAGAYFNLGLIAEAREDNEAALEAFSRAIEIEPLDAEFYFRRGGVFFARQEFARTVEDTTRAIELHPAGTITGPYIARGLAFLQLEEYPRALEDFGRAVEADPRGGAEAYFYRALVYLNQDEPMSARMDLQAFLLMTNELDGPLADQAREILEELDKA